MNLNDAKSTKSMNFLIKTVLFGPAVTLEFTTKKVSRHNFEFLIWKWFILQRYLLHKKVSDYNKKQKSTTKKYENA